MTTPISTPISTETLAVRADIEHEIAGLTLPLALQRTVDAYGDRPAYSDKVGIDVPAGGYAPGWRTVTWADLREQALDVAGALLAAGVEPGDRVALMASNRIEHVVADLGAVHAAAVSMSVYNTLSAEQVAFVAGHAEPAVVVLENADHLARWQRALAETAAIRRVVLIGVEAPEGDDRFVAWEDFLAAGRSWRADNRAGNRADNAAALESRTAAITPADPLTILYTSGTTGNPKGVVLTHHSVLFECASSLRVSVPSQDNEFISYLPFAHIAERTLGMYVPEINGGHIHLIADPAQLLGALGEVRPTRFFGVPRVWEKIRTGVSAKLAAETDPAKRAQVEQALAVGLEYVEAQQYGATPSPDLEARYRAVDEGLLGFLRALLGLDRCEWAASAAAPMPIEVARFFAGLGLPIYDVYGMTETCAAVTSCGPDQFRLGTVGRALPGIEIALAEDGEILARGPVTSSGYYRQDEATRQLIDEQGWVHTGDIGELDDDGFLKVVDRKKEMIITSSGKNIAPSNIENLLKESPVVGHALVFGEGRPYVVAVMTLDAEIAPLVAQKVGIEYGGDLAELAQHPAILAIAQQAVDAANERLSRPEQVKSWALLPVEWTAESEELTPTLKLKRRVVHAKYADVLDRLYA
ncbi:long-chain fatty acid--CoA ligase [Nocardioides sp. WS12]|uniref:AMP-dependent synthetase/ligase n=1 Tax=Nocardioides sp. WS12 TaxID=2486272 RepID=UPI0015F7C4D0|nr:long-chain fatty acid--CoA ligase [Nocardioides sp. WS12]